MKPLLTYDETTVNQLWNNNSQLSYYETSMVF